MLNSSEMYRIVYLIPEKFVSDSQSGKQSSFSFYGKFFDCNIVLENMGSTRQVNRTIQIPVHSLFGTRSLGIVKHLRNNHATTLLVLFMPQIKINPRHVL